ncbi:PEP-CTERM sorting domain-containing protein [Roseiconus lacunae]|uniref:PEP-CTERM sorting domain-containing protein n=1 Tax=Roseiconus lacunae TaxID=2605694 RepID=A0ABT7PHI3_9BACT|nr:PEP-CTERM sorting domain-containing protein [Roseiconus lacunae]MDM4015701.1 PEP-CTERM sorting domain-containing protein [Roseiconus lacunae]
MRKLISLMLLVAAMPSVQAEISYDVFFRANGVDAIGNTVLEVAPDSIVRGVEVVLREVTDGEVNQLGDGGGLRTYAIELNPSDPNLFENGARNPNFQLSATGNDGDTFTAFNFAGGTAGQTVAPNTVELSLGTVDLVGPTVGQQITFSLADFDPANPNFDLASGGSIDSLINFGNTLTLSSVTAIPEPSSFALIGTLGSVILMRRRRR